MLKGNLSWRPVHSKIFYMPLRPAAGAARWHGFFSIWFVSSLWARSPCDPRTYACVLESSWTPGNVIDRIDACVRVAPSSKANIQNPFAQYTGKPHKNACVQIVHKKDRHNNIYTSSVFNLLILRAFYNLFLKKW
jgi:hypothetical protein